MALTVDIEGELGTARLTDFLDGGPTQPPAGGFYDWVGADPSRYLRFTLNGSDPSIATLIEFGITGGGVIARSTTPFDITPLADAWSANGASGVAPLLFASGTIFELTAEAVASTLHTYGPANRLVGNDAANTLHADHADATIEGGEGNDTLFAGSGYPLLDGGDGDDLVMGGSGSTTIHGGAGWDVLSYETQLMAVHMSTSGLATHMHDGAWIEDDRFDGFEVLRTGSAGDFFDFDPSNQPPTGILLQGLSGDDIFSSGSGAIIDYSADDAFGGSLGVVVNMTADVLGKTGALPVDVASDAKAVLLATLGDTAEVAARSIRDGFGSVDMVLATFLIAGSLRGDFMLGGDDADTLGGNAGDDWLFGEAGSDSLSGGADGDRLFGGAGIDTLDGGGGDDLLEGGEAGDLLVGDTGTDTASYAQARAGVTASLANPALNRGDAAGDSFASIENLTGSRFGDTLVGDDGANLLDGGAGNDAMRGGKGDDTYVIGSTSDVADETGGAGRDTVRSAVNFSLADSKHAKGTIEALLLTGSAVKGTGSNRADALTGNGAANSLNGGAGNDTLTGNGGKDVLIGGAGKDAFVFISKPVASSADTIRDFGHHADRIWLDDAAMPGVGIAGKALTKTAFYSHSGATHGHDPNDRIIYDSKSGRLYYDDDGNGRHAAILLATLTGHPKLDAADFLIV